MKKCISFILIILLLLSVIPITYISAEDDVTSEETTIYFEAPEEWTGYNAVFCHIKEYGTDTPLASWQSKKEKCTLIEADNIYSYDVSKAGSLEPGKYYVVIFCTDTYEETYECLMSTSCYGDTLYCDGTTYESPMDGNKNLYIAYWKNQQKNICGPLLRITNIGEVVGTAIAPDTTAKTLISDFIVSGDFRTAAEYTNKSEVEILSEIAFELGISSDCLGDIIRDSEAWLFYQKFFDAVWANPECGTPVMFYDEVYYHYNEAGEMDWALIYGATPPPPWMVFPYAVFENLLIRALSPVKNFHLDYAIYDLEDDRFYDMTWVWYEDKYHDGIAEYIYTNEIGEIIGDMDNDRIITIKDATYIQKCLAGINDFPDNDAVEARFSPPTPNHELLAYVSDFNRDGVRNVKDATAIQKYLVGNSE